MKKELDQLFEKITENAKAAPHEPAEVGFFWLVDYVSDNLQICCCDSFHKTCN